MQSRPLKPLPLIRQQSVGQDINYNLILHAMRVLYEPTDNYFKEEGRDGSVYIKMSSDSDIKFSFHSDVGLGNKIHLTYKDRSIPKQIQLQISRNESNIVKINKKPSESVRLTSIENDELDRIERFISNIEYFLNPVIANQKRVTDNLAEDYDRLEKDYDRLRQDYDRLRQDYDRLSRQKRDDRSAPRNYDDRPVRERSRSRDRYSRNQKYNQTEDKDYKQLYIKYKSKYLKLKNKLH